MQSANLLDYAMIKADLRKEKYMAKMKDVHKCNRCIWATWTGNKFACPFGDCVKGKVKI